MPGESPLPGSWSAAFSLCPHMGEGAKELSGVLLTRTLIPFMRVLSSWPKHLPKAPSHWGLGVNTGILWGHIQSHPFVSLQYKSMGSYFILLRMGCSLSPGSFPVSPSSPSSTREKMIYLKHLFPRSASLPLRMRRLHFGYRIRSGFPTWHSEFSMTQASFPASPQVSYSQATERVHPNLPPSCYTFCLKHRARLFFKWIVHLRKLSSSSDLSHHLFTYLFLRPQTP